MHKIDVDDGASRARASMAKIKNKILILSNKGGVGKSSVAVNLAFALSKKGLKTGLLDTDIHGPSTAKMAGKEGRVPESNGKVLYPVEISKNLKMMSMGLLARESDSPVIWRGPLKMNVLKQFLSDVAWGELDYMVIDAPPGTGDEPLSMCQMIPEMTGGIIVTTGQDIALLDSKKAVNFLKKLNIPVIGIVENMTAFECPHCRKEINLFKSGGGKKAAKEMGVEFLGRIPFDPDMTDASDKGEMFMEKFPDSPAAVAINSIAGRFTT